MGAWGTGIDTLGALGMADGAGVTVAQTPQGVLTGVKEALTRHRVWDRFPTTGRLA